MLSPRGEAAAALRIGARVFKRASRTAAIDTDRYWLFARFTGQFATTSACGLGATWSSFVLIRLPAATIMAVARRSPVSIRKLRSVQQCRGGAPATLAGSGTLATLIGGGSLVQKMRLVEF